MVSITNLNPQADCDLFLVIEIGLEQTSYEANPSVSICAEITSLSGELEANVMVLLTATSTDSDGTFTTSTG